VTTRQDQRVPGQDAADRGQQDPLSGLKPGTWDLATEHRELVAQHEDLQVLGGIAAGEQHSSWMARHATTYASFDSTGCPPKGDRGLTVPSQSPARPGSSQAL
jgi:hypothetical protein